MSLIEIEYAMLKHLKMQPSELWAKPFYEIEYLIDLFKKDKEAEEKERKKQEDAQANESYKMPSVGSMFKEAQGSLGSFSSSIKMPKL